MARIAWRFLAGLVAAVAIAGQPARAADVLPDDASVDQVLDALDVVGHGLTDFTATVELTEADYSLMDIVTRTGKVWFQQLGEDDGRIRVLLDRETVEDETFLKKFEYRLQDGRLVDRDYQKKIEATRQVVRPGEKINLLKLGEGPFPLPIGQDKEEVYRLFTVTRLEPSADDVTGSIPIQLQPIAGTQFAGQFYQMRVWVDQERHLPAKIEVHRDNAETRIQTTVFHDFRMNVGLSDNDFELEKINEREWSLHEE